MSFSYLCFIYSNLVSSTSLLWGTSGYYMYSKKYYFVSSNEFAPLVAEPLVVQADYKSICHI